MTTVRKQKTAFIGHPTDIGIFRSYVRFLKPTKTYRDEFLIKLFEWTPPYKTKDFPGLSIDLKNSIDGMLIMVPFLPEMRDIKIKQIIGKIEQALVIAAAEGCTVAAMGGFTSIVLQGSEQSLSEKFGIKITSGNAFTAALIVRSIENIARKFSMDISQSTVAVIGASGDIGSACMGYFGSKVKKMYCTARSIPTLAEVVKRQGKLMTCEIAVTDNNREAVANSTICIFVTSAYTTLFSQEDFKPGTVVCDASAPVNVLVNQPLRDDVFIYHGGVASIPFKLEPGFDIGLPSPRTFYGCQLEGLLLGLNPSLPCSWGRGNITREKLNLFLREMDEHPLMDVVFSIGNHLYTEKQIERYAAKWNHAEIGLSRGEWTYESSYHGQALQPHT